MIATKLFQITFDHHGLAETTLVLTVITAISGFLLLGTRYGFPPRKAGQTVLRWAHVVFGVWMAFYLLGTYLFVPG